MSEIEKRPLQATTRTNTGQEIGGGWANWFNSAYETVHNSLSRAVLGRLRSFAITELRRDQNWCLSFTDRSDCELRRLCFERHQAVNDFRTKYGNLPDAGAATAYDAARPVFDAFTRAKSRNKSAVRDAPATAKHFPGVTGRITIDANRNAQVPVYILRIDKNGKFSLE